MDARFSATAAEANEFNFGLAAARQCLGTRTEHRNRYVIMGGDVRASEQTRVDQLSSKDRKAYNEGKYTVKHHNVGKFGFINSSGEWQIKPQYDSVRAFFVDSHGRTCALVTLGSKSIYIDTRGHVLNE